MLDHYIHVYTCRNSISWYIHVSAYNMQLAYVHVYVYTCFNERSCILIHISQGNGASKAG